MPSPPQNFEDALASRQSESIRELLERAMTEMGITFDMETAHSDSKLTITFYGGKGDAKTATALGLPGTIAAISLDNKTAAVWEELYQKNPRIEVFDGIRHLNDSFDYYAITSAITHEYIIYLLTEIAKRTTKPNWILIDGLEILSSLCEMKMRYKNKLGMSEGVANRNLWKERKLYIREVHHAALRACNYGVIYTTYTEKDEIVKDGEFITKDDIPKWADLIMYETDIVIRTKTVPNKTGNQYKLKVISSKFSSILQSGLVIDLTGGKTISQLAPQLTARLQERASATPAQPPSQPSSQPKPEKKTKAHKIPPPTPSPTPTPPPTTTPEPAAEGDDLF